MQNYIWFQLTAAIVFFAFVFLFVSFVFFLFFFPEKDISNFCKNFIISIDLRKMFQSKIIEVNYYEISGHLTSKKRNKLKERPVKRDKLSFNSTGIN